MKIEELSQIEDLSWENLEREELAQILDNVYLKRALAIIYQGMQDQQRGLMHYNLEDPIQRAEATKLQGKLLGVDELLDGLIDLATQEKNDG